MLYVDVMLDRDSTTQYREHLHPMLDPDVSNGPWISGHRFPYKNSKNDTAAF